MMTSRRMDFWIYLPRLVRTCITEADTMQMLLLQDLQRRHQQVLDLEHLNLKASRYYLSIWRCRYSMSQYRRRVPRNTRPPQDTPAKTHRNLRTYINYYPSCLECTKTHSARDDVRRKVCVSQEEAEEVYLHIDGSYLTINWARLPAH